MAFCLMRARARACAHTQVAGFLEHVRKREADQDWDLSDSQAKILADLRRLTWT